MGALISSRKVIAFEPRFPLFRADRAEMVALAEQLLYQSAAQVATRPGAVRLPGRATACRVREGPPSLCSRPGRAGKLHLAKPLLAFGYAVSAPPWNLRAAWALRVSLTLAMQGPKGRRGVETAAALPACPVRRPAPGVAGGFARGIRALALALPQAMSTSMPRLRKAVASASAIPLSVTKEWISSSDPRRVKLDLLILLESATR